MTNGVLSSRKKVLGLDSNYPENLAHVYLETARKRRPRTAQGSCPRTGFGWFMPARAAKPSQQLPTNPQTILSVLGTSEPLKATGELETFLASSFGPY